MPFWKVPEAIKATHHSRKNDITELLNQEFGTQKN